MNRRRKEPILQSSPNRVIVSNGLKRVFALAEMIAPTSTLLKDEDSEREKGKAKARARTAVEIDPNPGEEIANLEREAGINLPAPGDARKKGETPVRSGENLHQVKLIANHAHTI